MGIPILVSEAESNIMVDAGLSCRELERRMSLFGVEATQIDAVLLTHEHTDHTRGVRRFCIEHALPVYATRGTHALTTLDGVDTRTIAAGAEFRLNGLAIRPFKSSILLPSRGILCLGEFHEDRIASDLGCITPVVVKEMSGSSLMFVEANYDERMLSEGNYPDFLKRAIRSDHGHLSNDDAGSLSRIASSDGTRMVVLVHLSKDNNTPELARSAVVDQLDARSIPDRSHRAR